MRTEIREDNTKVTQPEILCGFIVETGTLMLLCTGCLELGRAGRREHGPGKLSQAGQHLDRQSSKEG